MALIEAPARAAHLFELLVEAGYPELQERIWVHHERVADVSYSFIDLMVELFDNENLPQAVGEGFARYGLDASLQPLLQQFCAAADAYQVPALAQRGWNPRYILADPAWANVAAAARAVVEAWLEVSPRMALRSPLYLALQAQG